MKQFFNVNSNSFYFIVVYSVLDEQRRSKDREYAGCHGEVEYPYIPSESRRIRGGQPDGYP